MKINVYNDLISIEKMKNYINDVLTENGYLRIDENEIIEILVKNGYIIRMPDGICHVSEIGTSVGIVNNSQLFLPMEIQKEIIIKCIRNNCLNDEEAKYSRKQYRKLSERLPSTVIFLDGRDRFYSYSESAEKLSEILGIDVYRNSDDEAGIAFYRSDMDSIENILIGNRIKYYIYSSIVPNVEFEYVNASENAEDNNLIITAVVGSRVTIDDNGEIIDVILAIPRSVEVRYSNLYNVEMHMTYDGLTLEKLGAGYVGINTPVGAALIGAREGDNVVVRDEDGNSRNIYICNIDNVN